MFENKVAGKFIKSPYDNRTSPGDSFDCYGKGFFESFKLTFVKIN